MLGSGGFSMKSTDSQLIRLTSSLYSDDLSEMRDGADPMTIAATVFDQEDHMPNPEGLSNLFTNWGQFLDHDLSLTPDASGEFVMVPGMMAPVERSVYDDTTGIDGPRQQVNVITPEIDGSMIYGSDRARTKMLREFEGGRLKMSEEGYMPLSEPGDMAGSTEEKPLFLAGDVRANENVGLTVLHTLFVREHNYWADRLADEHPRWSDKKIFKAARSIVEYEVQKITYDDWLPHLIGDATPEDTRWNRHVSTDISNEFSTAAFRFGHTMVTSEIARIEEDGSETEGGPLTVRDVFFNNDPMYTGGLDDLLRGAAGSVAQESDATIIDDLNFFLETPAGLSGFSLAALNIVRGRDHGLDTYVEVREELLGDIDPDAIDPTDFSIITSDVEIAARLSEAYETVHDVDLWVGGLAEDNIEGTQLGALFTEIVAEQFSRTQEGDRSFGKLHRRVRDLKEELDETTLADIIVRNSEVESIQEDVFVFEERTEDGFPEPVEPEMPAVCEFPVPFADWQKPVSCFANWFGERDGAFVKHWDTDDRPESCFGFDWG